MAITFNHNDQVYVKDGKMGIGASDPLRDLHVVGNFAVNAGTDEYYGVLIQGGESANPTITIGDWHNSSATIKWDSSANHLVIDSQHSTSTSSIVFTGNDSATEYMRIDSSGNVGIGTTTPAYKLDVNGSLHSSNITLADGIYHEGDSNTYINFLTDVIQMSTAGTVRTYINSSGNVGIGTTSPDTKLHIEDGNPFLTLRGNNSSYSNAGIQLISGHASNNRALGIFHYIENSDVEWFAGLPYSGNDAYVINRNTGYTVPSSQSDGGGGRGASGGRLLTINSSGNVGIGTSSPNFKLDVNGDVRVESEHFLRFGGVGSSDSKWVIQKNGSGDLNFGETGVSDGRLYLKAGGNVGIGTTSPGGKLSVFAANGNEDSLRLGRADTGNVWRFNHAGADLRIYNLSSSGSDIIFGTDAGGNAQSNRVSIGTASPQSPLTVKSNSTSAANSGFTLLANGSTDIIAAIGEKSTNGGRFHLYDGGVQKVAFFSDGTDNFIAQGNLGIGTTTPSFTLGSGLEIEKSGTSTLRLQSSGSHASEINQSTSSLTIADLSSGLMIFKTGNVESMRINSSNDVGIGTTSPSKKLHISDDNDAPLRVESTDPTTGIDFKDNSNSSQLYYVGGSDHFYIPSGTSLGVGASSPTLSSMLRVYSNQTTADENVYGSFFDFNASGSDTLTENRTQAAIYVDADSSATGGSTASGTEHRFYGIYSDTRASGDSDFIAGITTRAEANASSGQVTNTRGGEFLAVSDGSDSAATHNNVIGSFSSAYGEDAATISSLEGARSYAYVSSNRTTDITTLTGHSSEVEINADNTYGTAYLYRGTLDINSTHTITDTYAFRYDISGTSVATNNWGIYIDDVDKNYVSGKLGIGTGSPGENLTISGKVLSYGGTGTVGAGTSYFLGNSNNSRDIALTRVDSGALGIGRYNSGWLETMRFTIDGNVGIGTTSPSATLDVSGGSLKVQSGDTFGYDNHAAAIYIDDSSGKGLSGKFATNGYSRNLIRSDGSATIQIGDITSLISLIKLDAGSSGVNGVIAFRTKASERMRVHHDGNVGIGTTSPDTRLHIYENAAAPVLLTLNNYQGDINPNGSQGNFIDFKMTDDNNTFTPQVRIGMIVKDSDGDSGLISEGCGNFVVYTGEGTDQGGSGTLTEHFRITDKGDVGIGTNSPGHKLQVEGVISAGTANSTDGSLILVGKYNNGNIITIGGGYSGGGVVIGYGVKPSTTAAGAFLSSSALANLERSAYVQYGSVHQWWTGAYQTVAVDSAATLTQSMTLDGSGNLGIGTTSPGAKLHANASSGVVFKVSPNSTSKEWYIDTTNPDHLKKEENLVLSADPGNTHTNTVIGFRIDNSTKMQIKSDGKVGIGTTSPAYLLDVSGTIRATGDVIAYSDARVKENVETIPNALDKVKGMRGVGYNKIGEEKRSVGVIAQELLEVLPEAVHQDDQGMYSVAYGNIVGVLVEAMKEQQQQIEELKAIIDGITE